MTMSVHQRASAIGWTSRLIPHVAAALLALYYARLVSHTRFVTTGLEFVAPLAIVMATHLAWVWAFERPEPRFAERVLGRSLVTTAAMVALIVFVALYAPAPAKASPQPGSLSADLVTSLAMLACLAVLASVIFVAAAAIYVAVLGALALFKLLRRQLGRPPGSGGNRLNDFGFVAIAFLLVGTASVEGIAPVFSFSAFDRVASTVTVAAPPARVWQEIGKATSPSFPLPVMLKSIPQPVAVVIDEGAALGARRIVHFKGREGEGDLVLQVTRRTDDEVTFRAVSDSSPIAKWVRQRGLSFRVEPNGTGSLLTVSSEYDRLLAPAWFFRPYLRLASFLAVNVLASDTKERAEAR